MEVLETSPGGKLNKSQLISGAEEGLKPGCDAGGGEGSRNVGWNKKIELHYKTYAKHRPQKRIKVYREGVGKTASERMLIFRITKDCLKSEPEEGSNKPLTLKEFDEVLVQVKSSTSLRAGQ